MLSEESTALLFSERMNAAKNGYAADVCVYFAQYSLVYTFLHLFSSLIERKREREDTN